MRKKKNAFTLIELIAVLVILAIIALIVTPLVMNIVKKAKDSANKRSVDAYGKAVELAVATHLLDYGDYPTSLDNLKVEYTGNEVICNVKKLNEDGSIYLSECSVKGAEVKDSSTEDGWYHYGKSSNKDVTYQAYNVGDVITYNGMEFYVIENSDENSDRVTMLKAEPLTVDEVNTYGGVGTENNHVNMHVEPSSSYYQTANDMNGYGGIAYYSSLTCGYDANGYRLTDGCTADYAQSEVKFIVDAWVNDKTNRTDLTEDSTGYSARLITYDEYMNNFEFEEKTSISGDIYTSAIPMFDWMHNENYSYWTMSVYNDYTFSVWRVHNNNGWNNHDVYDGYGNVVRPVITLLKSAL